MKRMVWLAIALGLACTFWAFAGGSSEKSTAAKQVEITWLMRANPFENKWERDQAIPGFEALHPNVKVQLIIVPFLDVDPKLDTMIAAGTPPDVFSEWGASGFGDYYRRGLLLDLTPYVKKDINMSDFIPGVFSIFERNGHYYGLPQVTNFGLTLVYNKKLFQTAGLPDLPTKWGDSSWTWDKMTQYAQKLTKNYGQANAEYGIYFGPNSRDTMLQLLPYLWGGNAYSAQQYTNGIAPSTNVNSPVVVRALQNWQDLIYKDHVYPTPADAGAVNQLGSFMATGKIGMGVMLPTQAYGNLKSAPFKWGLAPLPQGTAVKTILFNGLWFISKTSKNPDQAWQLLQYLITKNAADAFAKTTGFLVPREDSVQTWLQLFEGPTGMSTAQLQQAIVEYPRDSVETVNHLFVQYAEIKNTIHDAMDPLLYGQESAQQDIASSLGPKLNEVVKKIYDTYQK